MILIHDYKVKKRVTSKLYLDFFYGLHSCDGR